ncbi:hypothetical protein B841_01420 [Corynebacterium maris DSM 45190]|uniref:DUF2020 domain-containing protein n=1 Tax=Corynebacterium maris DSM 45190 TaxID=1224163 RepID=S5SRW4_9CORY|nr:hypothetical protein B841_01420 [Corynebacterium maris DSM 45190]
MTAGSASLRYRFIAAVSGAALLLGACTTTPVEEPAAEQETQASTPESAPVLDSGLPIDAAPEVPAGKESWTECPYLDTHWVAETNGQRMTAVGVDERFDVPACVFWSYPDEPQAQVIVRHLQDEDEATAVVDWAAPVDHTEPADQPAGWMGGRGGGGRVPDVDGAVYAVQSGPVAVVVFTNQGQSFKAEQIALEAIANLGL